MREIIKDGDHPAYAVGGLSGIAISGVAVLGFEEPSSHLPVNYVDDRTTALQNQISGLSQSKDTLGSLPGAQASISTINHQIARKQNQLKEVPSTVPKDTSAAEVFGTVIGIELACIGVATAIAARMRLRKAANA